jgi:hypothetical protein
MSSGATLYLDALGNWVVLKVGREVADPETLVGGR